MYLAVNRVGVGGSGRAQKGDSECFELPIPLRHPCTFVFNI
jgi:hypothetical protein